jgi:hypothetical protein
VIKLFVLIQFHAFQALTPTCNPAAGADNYAQTLGLDGFLNGIINSLYIVGGSICVIGLIIGGLMRATAFGSESRIAKSNLALSCAVVGFLIIVFASPIKNALTNIKVTC